MTAPLSRTAHWEEEAVARQRLGFSLRLGVAERWGVIVALCYAAAAVGLTGVLHLGAPEAVQRTVHLGVLLDGVDVTPVAFGLDRPPLPTLLAAPFAFVEPLRAHGLATALGAAVGAIFAVPVAASLARWAGFSRAGTALFVAAFAFHPLLLFAGATGLPEPLYATLLLAALGAFARWLDDESIGAVIMAGALLGIAFLVRYNVVLVALVLAAMVLWVGHRRSAPHERPDRAQAWVFALLVPLVFAAGLWALVTWFAYGNPLEFLREASRLSALAQDDAGLLARMEAVGRDPAEVGRWLGGRAALVSLPSAVAIAVLLIAGARRRDVAPLALGVVLASVLLPEAVALLSGHGQPHTSHLYAFVVPAFVAVAWWERRAGGGVAPGAYDARRRRRQRRIGATLLVGGLVSAALLALVPGADAPAARTLEAMREREPVTTGASVQAVAAWVRQEAGQGEVFADIERHSEVLLATASFDRFRVAASDDGDAALADPHGVASYVLVREPLAGQGAGWIERTHPGLFAAGRPFMRLHRDFGSYRIYEVTGPALP